MTKKFAELGLIAWLWSNSDMHKHWTFSLFATNVIPAIETGQYVILKREDMPVAYCSWANLSLENEVKYINDVTSLELADWQSGDRKWFIDWIAPFGDSYLLTRHMRTVFERDLFRAVRVDGNSNVGKISEFYGRKVDVKLAKEKFKQYHQDLIAKLSAQNNFVVSKSE